MHNFESLGKEEADFPVSWRAVLSLAHGRGEGAGVGGVLDPTAAQATLFCRDH